MGTAEPRLTAMHCPSFVQNSSSWLLLVHNSGKHAYFVFASVERGCTGSFRSVGSRQLAAAHRGMSSNNAATRISCNGRQSVTMVQGPAETRSWTQNTGCGFAEYKFTSLNIEDLPSLWAILNTVRHHPMHQLQSECRLSHCAERSCHAEGPRSTCREREPAL
jgi:hypothetical protein